MGSFTLCSAAEQADRGGPILPQVFSQALALLLNQPWFSPGAPLPLQIDVELTKGNKVSIKLKAIGELQPSGMREVWPAALS